MRVVIDLNVLASASISPEGIPAALVDFLIERSYEIVLSETMLARLANVLKRPYFATRLSQKERDNTIRRYRKIAIIETPDETVVGVADDAEDDRVLGTAVAGNADVIVTGDKGLLALHPFRGIAILTAREFLDLVGP